MVPVNKDLYPRAILRHPTRGYDEVQCKNVTLDKGTLVVVDFYASLAFSGNVVIDFEYYKRVHLFEPLDPDDVLGGQHE